MNNNDIKERIIRILIFIIGSFIILRYLLGLTLSDIDQIKIVFGISVCFMFVNTYYPVVITQ
jgi:hypothetical protein